MEFKPLYYADKLTLINPYGDVGITTLWSRHAYVIDSLKQLEIDLSPQTSRVAVIGNLYGNGLPQLLRNLLYNPQIKWLLIVGQNLSGSQEELLQFFTHGLEPCDFLGNRTYRIVNTKRILDNLVQPSDFKNNLQLSSITEKLTTDEGKRKLQAFFAHLPEKTPCLLERVNIPLATSAVKRFPSEPRNHTILETTPLRAWRGLIARLVRFGYPVTLKKGERLELQNVKVIVETPQEESEEILAQYGFSLMHFRRYQSHILQEDLFGLSYTYGNRLRNYFKYGSEQIDSIETVVRRLQDDKETRHAYIAVWDNHHDLPRGHSCPCLVSLFFRVFAEELTLTATFRSHNALDAWLENVYGLIAILFYVADKTGYKAGAITVFSHSLTLDTRELARARLIAQDYEAGWKEDPNGDFGVTIDKSTQEIVVQHNYRGAVLFEYRGKTAREIERQLTRDQAVSSIGHAFYLGREIALCEQRMRKRES